MSDKQLEVLRLAYEMTMAYSLYHACLENPERHMTVLLDAAAELRRLYEENETLKRCLFQMQEAAKAQRNSAPPLREWVGLTDEEIKSTLKAAGLDAWYSERHAARVIEAKLKERNA